MKCIAVGDFHVTPFGEFSRVPDNNGVTARSRVVAETACWINDLALKHTAFVVLNGDVTDTPGVLDAATMDLLRVVLGEFEGTQLFLNIGNHDKSRRQGMYHNLSLMSRCGGVTVVDSNFPYLLPTRREPEAWVIPYTFDKQSQLDMLEIVPKGSMVFVHYPILGVRMTPIRAEESANALTREDLHDYMVVASHYHIPQGNQGRLRPGDILVTGTPYAHSFGDTNPEYGVWLIDFDTMEVTFHANPHSPKYVTLEDPSPSDVEDAKRSATYVKVITSTNDTYGEGVKHVRKPTPNKVSEGTIPDKLRTFFEAVPNGGNIAQEITSRLATLKDQNQPEVSMKSLEGSNFLSWGSFSASFPQGVTLVTGVNEDAVKAVSNGSGKSGYLEALTWVLFGRTPRGVTGDAVIREGQRSGSVTLVLTSDDVEWTITRSKTRGSSARVTLFSGGEERTDWSVAECDTQIEKLVGCDFERFSTLHFWSGGLPYRLTSMAPTALTNLVEEVFGLNQIDTVRDSVAQELSSSKIELSNAVSKLEKLDISKQDIESRLVLKREWLAEADSRIEAHMFEVAKAHASLSSLQSEMESIPVVDLSVIEEFARLEHAVSTYEEAAPCKSCGFRDVVSGREALILQRDSLLQSCTEAKKNLQRRTYLAADVRVSEGVLQSLVKTTPTDAIAQRLVEDITGLEDQRATLEGTRENLKQEETGWSTKVDFLSEVLSHLSPKGIRSILLSDAVASWNTYLAGAMEELFGDGFSMQVDTSKTLKSGKETNVLSFNSGDRDYNSYSGGEKRKLDFALLLSLMRAVEGSSGKINVLILDEVLDTLDTVAIKSVLDVLTQLPKCVIVVSHNDIVDNNIVDRVTVVKRRGMSIVNT